MSEIVTLQFGHYSNFIATHWWNLQESSFVYTSDPAIPKEINHDVLFREGQNRAREVTYTPRLVACDLKGSLNTLREEGILYDVGEKDEVDIKWESDVTLHKAEQAKKNRFLTDLDREAPGDVDYNTAGKDEDEKEKAVPPDVMPHKTAVTLDVAEPYNLDNSITVWSDFLRPYFHPKSLCVVNQYRHQSESEPFNVFGNGLDVYRSHSWHESFEDKLHFFLEDCDNIQGFHIMIDTHDAFMGLASGSVEELAEEYSTKGLMIFASAPVPSPGISYRQNHYRLLNSLLGYEKLYAHASMIIPMSLDDQIWSKSPHPKIFPYLNYKSDLNYHTSAILAATLDTVTMPYRVVRSPALMTHMIQALTPLGRKIISLQSSLPFPLHTGETLIDSIMKYKNEVPWQSLTPYCPASAISDGQSVVLRGISNSQLKGPRKPSIHEAFGKCDTIEELLQVYLVETTSTSLNAVCHLQQPLKISAPFPNIFQHNVSAGGFIQEAKRPMPTQVESVPVFSSLQSTATSGNILEVLLSETAKLNIRKYHRFLESGLEQDDYVEIRENLQTVQDGYTCQAGVMH